MTWSVLRVDRLRHAVRISITRSANLIQRAATPAYACGGKSDQVLVPSGKADMQPLPLKDTEKLSASSASPFAFHIPPPSFSNWREVWKAGLYAECTNSVFSLY